MQRPVKLTVKRLGNDGEGIAYYKGKPVFIDFSLIQEEVEVKLQVNSRGNYEGKDLKVLKPSPIRIEAPCPYYLECGGCNLQHMPYFETIKHKRNVINFLYNVNLRKETKKTKLNYTILSPDEYRYRNKVVLPVREINGQLEVGLYYKDTNRLLPIKGCLVHRLNIDLLIENMLEIFNRHQISAFNPKRKKGVLRFIIVRTNQSGDFQVTFVTKDHIDMQPIADEIATNNPKVKSIFETFNKDLKARDFFGNKTKLLYGDQYLVESIDDKKFLLAPDSFFQLNLKQAKNMYDEVIRLAEFNENDVVLDGYAGVASIGIYVSDLVKSVYSIEINESAIEAAKQSLILNQINNVYLYSGDTLEIAKTLDEKPNIMIFNPPRSGLGEKLSQFIVSQQPNKVVYCSCNPKTLVDDLKILALKYDIIETTPIDMFPQTGHVETIVLLSLKTA